MRQVKINQPHIAVAGHQHVFRLEIEVHVAALVHVAQAQRHVNQDLRDIFRQDGVMLREQFLQIRRLDVIHDHVKCSALPAMFHIADDIIALIDFGKHLAPAQKPAAGQQIEPQPVIQFPQGVRFAAAVRHEPDFGHAAAVDEFLCIKPPKPFLFQRFGRPCFLRFTRHSVYSLARCARQGEQNFFHHSNLQA